MFFHTRSDCVDHDGGWCIEDEEDEKDDEDDEEDEAGPGGSEDDEEDEAGPDCNSSLSLVTDASSCPSPNLELKWSLPN